MMPFVTTVVAGVKIPAAHETPACPLAVKERAVSAPETPSVPVSKELPAGTMTEPLLITSWPAVKPDVGVVEAVRTEVAVPVKETGRGVAAEMGTQEVVVCPLTTVVTAKQMDADCWAAAGTSPTAIKSKAKKVFSLTRRARARRGVRRSLITLASLYGLDWLRVVRRDEGDGYGRRRAGLRPALLEFHEAGLVCVGLHYLEQFAD
jgi:hypothetical protein